MKLVRNYWVYVVVVVLLLGAFFGWRYYERTRVPAFPISSQDSITSWSFRGAYTNNAALAAQAQADIASSTTAIAHGSNYTPYLLYIDIGDQYLLLGDGKSAYNAFNRAEHVGQGEGLPYVNIGALMTTLGAYHTAAAAYAKAVALQPRVLQFHVERLDFLTKYLPNDNAEIQAAIKDASDNFGDTAPILVIEAGWLEATGHLSDALKAYETAKALSPVSSWPPLDTEITRLKKELSS